MTATRGMCTFLLLALALSLGCGQNREDEALELLEGSSAANPERFVADAEAELETLGRKAVLANFLKGYDWTEENVRLAQEASATFNARSVALAREAVRYDGLELSATVTRKLALIKRATSFPAPTDPAAAAELSEITTSIADHYISAQDCIDRSPCRKKLELYRVVREVKDPAEKQQAWLEWHDLARAIRGPYARMVEIANRGARDLGFDNIGAIARSHYDMSPAEFRSEYERLWSEVRPLYEALHCHVRARLHEIYPDQVPASGPIPAHLLGNMWAQFWTALAGQVGPAVVGQRIDLTQLLKAKGYGPMEMHKTGEAFFRSLGFPALPESYWKESMFVEPTDRTVDCQGAAWPIDPSAGDVRMSLCTEVGDQHFRVIHHELGHIYNFLSYANQPYLFQNTANPGFQEGMGDAIVLSITPAYLQEIGLLDEPPGQDADLPYLFSTALEYVPRLAMAVVVDQWRWAVFAGEVVPESYNAGWWELRHGIQGVAPPLPRTESDFDPGMFYHVAHNVPFDRYFTALILQFDIHKALCEAAGHEGPLHLCSIYGSQEAGERLRRMLALGSSQASQDALEILTGRREISASSLVAYFAPVTEWLEEQNEGRVCGW